MSDERCAYVDAKTGLKHSAQRRPFPGALGLKLYKIVSVLPEECTTDNELYGQPAYWQHIHMSNAVSMVIFFIRLFFFFLLTFLPIAPAKGSFLWSL